MAEEVSDVIRQTYGDGVLIAGVGLGGEVAAEIAATQPALVSGLVMVDVDFYKSEGWAELVERLPWVGTAATYALETAGTLANDRWAPNCEAGGWCPTSSQMAARDLAETVVGTSQSIHAFRRTPAASQVPSKLSEITVPTQYLWSQAGNVPRDSVDKVQQAMPGAAFEVVPDAWRAHLDSPDMVAAAISSLAPQG
jgi:pimeloyl-ACP methyl ester carboxylesterase